MRSFRDGPEVGAAEQLLGRAIARARELGGAPEAVVVLARTAERGILAVAARHNAALVLVGCSHVSTNAPAGGPEEHWPDRLAHRLALHLPAPLIIARVRPRDVSRVVVHVHPSHDLRATRPLVRALVRSTQRRVRYLLLAKTASDAAEAANVVRAQLTAHNLDRLGDLETVQTRHAASTLLEYANGHDVAVLHTAPHPSLTESLFGTQSEHIATQAESSVFLVRPALDGPAALRGHREAEMLSGPR
jgi:nucleotide-binding universal stress UspA family protein